MAKVLEERSKIRKVVFSHDEQVEIARYIVEVSVCSGDNAKKNLDFVLGWSHEKGFSVTKDEAVALIWESRVVPLEAVVANRRQRILKRKLRWVEIRREAFGEVKKIIKERCGKLLKKASKVNAFGWNEDHAIARFFVLLSGCCGEEPNVCVDAILDWSDHNGHFLTREFAWMIVSIVFSDAKSLNRNSEPDVREIPKETIIFGPMSQSSAKVS